MRGEEEKAKVILLSYLKKFGVRTASCHNSFVLVPRLLAVSLSQFFCFGAKTASYQPRSTTCSISDLRSQMPPSNKSQHDAFKRDWELG